MANREIVTDAERLRPLLPFTDPKFWIRVDTSSDEGCWPYLGYVMPNGYGQVRRVIDGKNKAYLAHRYAYQIIFGSIPDELKVCHECDNRRCVRPSHLWPGTQAQNLADARKKGRYIPWGGKKPDNRGERQGRATLSDQCALENREVWETELGITFTELGRRFNLDRRTVSRVVYRQTFAHI